MTMMAAFDMAALLAHHPVEGWLAGLCAFALLGWGGLHGLRAVRRLPAPFRRGGPPPASRPLLLLAALGASACTLALAGAAMAELAESGQTHGSWAVFDETLAAGLRAHADMSVLRWFAALTHLGDAGLLTALALAVAAALWLRQHRLLALTWVAALAGNGALTKILKRLFERARPEHLHGIAQADGYGFPSGHSSASMVAWAMLAYLAARLLPRPWHAPAAMLAGILIFTTGWSRVVLHVHYASDVLAGWLLGSTWMVCTVLVMESVARAHGPAAARSRVGWG